MAKTTHEAHSEVLITNTIFTSGKGTPQMVACRVRGESNAKTLKVPAWMFGDNLPVPGEAVFLHSGTIEDDDASNYRLLRNGKVSLSSSSEQPPTPPSPAEDPVF